MNEFLMIFFDKAGSEEADPNFLLKMDNIALYQDVVVLAIELQEFSLYFQPIVNTLTLAEDFQHYEALIRWEHPIKGMIPPDHFIHIAEKSGAIIPLGYWVIHEVCRCLSQPSVPQNVSVSINLSPVQFKEASLVQSIVKIIKSYGISTNRITIEITETSAMRDHQLTRKVFAAFHAEGFKLSMDDFGTGYSSLSYLLNFNFDIIKIDKSFIANTLVDGEYEIIAKAVVKLAHDLSLIVVCEGIETDDQLQMVSEWKTDFIQGYLISKPRPWSEFY